MLCSKCGQVKTVTEFNREAGIARGYAYHCKSCCKDDRLEQKQRRIAVGFAAPRSEVRECRVCHETKSLDAFGTNRSKVDGRNTRCKECACRARLKHRQTHLTERREYERHSYYKYRQQVLARAKAFATSNPLVMKDRKLRERYGIGLAQFEAMLTAQNGRCAICDEAVPLVVDHDHKTGVVRDLLCEQCNHGLGRFRDNIMFLLSAARYLQRHSDQMERTA
jgi:hypothetical protein